VKINIVYIVNAFSLTSIPIEVAEKLANFENATVISLYDENAHIIDEISNLKVIGLGFRKNKLKSILYFIKFLIELSPDIVHTHHTLSGAIARILTKLFTKSQLVTTIHTDLLYLRKNQIRVLKVGLGYVDTLICNSKNTLQSFNRIFPNILNKNIKEVIYNGVDFDLIKSSNSLELKSFYNINDNDILIGVIGRLEKVKNHKILIDSLKDLTLKYSNIKLIIVGDGSQMQSIKLRVKKLKLEQYVIFTGVLSKDEAYKVLNMINIFVMPSIYEGFCNSVAEAMLAKKDLIVSDILTLREVTQNHAIYFNNTDHNDLTKKIINVIETNPMERIERLYKIAKKNYILNVTINNHLELYYKLIKSSNK
jgi:glycosyltransferase involved in cell wall biosynthesis